ncbi:MAG: lipase family protein [Gammaproteobacteria bacterium]|nr:lipase family protein [Gammaproteobacteria bacterium]
MRVESGFSDIYRNGDGTVASMQRQLFALIDKYQASIRLISEIYITGHSLGAALSQLFSLDVTLSRPTIPTTNIDFASPRVGNGAFVSFYEKSSPHTTLRVQNTYDAVPRVPTTELGFEHTTSVYLIAFHSTGKLGKLDFKASHSSINYQTVIRCAAKNDEGVCNTKRLLGADGENSIRSERPDVQTQ